MDAEAAVTGVLPRSLARPRFSRALNVAQRGSQKTVGRAKVGLRLSVGTGGFDRVVERIERVEHHSTRRSFPSGVDSETVTTHNARHQRAPESQRLFASVPKSRGFSS